MALIAGIDAGGTKTVGCLSDESGAVIRTARQGGANLHTHGELSVEKTLAALLEDLCPNGERLDALCIGMAGVDRPGEDAVVRSMLRRLGYRTNALVVNDAVIVLAAAGALREGIVVIGGTGSIVFGVNGKGETGRAGGLGPVLADEGSAGWVGHQALVAVARSADGRERKTLLHDLVLRALGVGSVSDLVPKIYGGSWTREQMAALAPIVSEAAHSGDGIAQDILERAAMELVIATRAVATKLNLVDSAFAVILSGGFLLSAAPVRAIFEKRLGLANAQVRTLEKEPATGALVMARELLHSLRNPK